MDATLIVTFHREGMLAHRTLLSLARTTQVAEEAGYRVQWVLTLDSADDETRRVVAEFPFMPQDSIVAEVAFRDLGLSRNHAVQLATGTHIGICDGDDYLSGDWLVRCLADATSSPPTHIWHPEYIVLFDAWRAVSVQIGQDDPSFDPSVMLIVNPWNSCSFAHRTTYLQFPYAEARPGETGFGFEDWHWNCETVGAGFVHRIARHTLHCVRRKISGSLNQAHANARAVIAPTRLFSRPDCQ